MLIAGPTKFVLARCDLDYRWEIQDEMGRKQFLFLSISSQGFVLVLREIESTRLSVCLFVCQPFWPQIHQAHAVVYPKQDLSGFKGRIPNDRGRAKSRRQIIGVTDSGKPPNCVRILFAGTAEHGHLAGSVIAEAACSPPLFGTGCV